MSENSYSLMLRNLSEAYYQETISFEDYRVQRKIILDKIDEDFNGLQALPLETEREDKVESSESLFMQTISFFRNKDSK